MEHALALARSQLRYGLQVRAVRNIRRAAAELEGEEARRVGSLAALAMADPAAALRELEDLT